MDAFPASSTSIAICNNEARHRYETARGCGPSNTHLSDTRSVCSGFECDAWFEAEAAVIVFDWSWQMVLTVYRRLLSAIITPSS